MTEQEEDYLVQENESLHRQVIEQAKRLVRYKGVIGCLATQQDEHYHRCFSNRDIEGALPDTDIQEDSKTIVVSVGMGS